MIFRNIVLSDKNEKMDYSIHKVGDWTSGVNTSSRS